MTGFAMERVAVNQPGAKIFEEWGCDGGTGIGEGGVRGRLVSWHQSQSWSFYETKKRRVPL